MAYNTTSLKDGLAKTAEWLKKEYSSLHTGQANPSVLDGLTVDSYGTRQPIKNVASISIDDPKTLRVVPWDKSQLKEIENAVITSDLGLSVATDDIGLRVIFPQLTGETRERLVKVLKAKLEDARVSIRKEREIAMKDIDSKTKAGEMSEDDQKFAEKEVQKFVDDANKELEDIFKQKENSVLTK
jgi:ribosome recycling factor